MTLRNPYKLFDAYTAADANIFFGREREISAVVGDILSNKLLVLFAKSGSGKSSLINAGIGPAMRAVGTIDPTNPEIRLVTIRLSGDETPEQSAVKALRSELGRLVPAEKAGLHEALKSVAGFTIPDEKTAHAPVRPRQGVVLVFDQFEELFITAFKDKADVRETFARLLGDLLDDDDLLVYVVLSLRSEYFHHLVEFREVIPSIFENNATLELRPFDVDTAARVIRGPAERAGSGFSWEPGLPPRIAKDLESLNHQEDGVLPIQLQIVCHGLVERAFPDSRQAAVSLPIDVEPAPSDVALPDKLSSSDAQITFALYNQQLRAGDKNPAQSMIHRAIVKPLDRIAARRPRQLCRLLRALITRQKTKVARSLQELKDILPMERAASLLAKLAAHQLVKEERSGAGTWYELRHDYLAGEISEWLDTRERELDRRDLTIRLFTIVMVAIASALGGRLCWDWNTYTSDLGISDRPNELIVKRSPPLGLPQPHWWKREISTGIPRHSTQFSGVPRLSLAAPHRQLDWTALEPLLVTNSRSAWQLATRFPATQSESALAWTDSVSHPDIALYAVVDSNIFEYVLQVLGEGKPESKSAAARALERVARISQEPATVERVIVKLLAALNDPSSDVKRAIASPLGAAVSVLKEPAAIERVIDKLLAALNDLDSDGKWATAFALGAAVSALKEPAAIERVIDKLLAALNDSDSGVKRAAASALGTAVSTVKEPATIERVIDKLLATLNDPDSDVKRTAAFALGRAVSASKEPSTVEQVIDTLLTTLNDPDSDVKRAAVAALGTAVSASKEPATVEQVINKLLAMLNDPNFYGKRTAASALETAVSASKEPATVERVIDKLLAALNDPDSDVKRAAASALETAVSAVKEPAAIERVIDKLLAALNDPDSDVKRVAAFALETTVSASTKPATVERVIDTLLAALTDPSSYVKQAAASALGTAVSASKESAAIERVIDKLFAALNDPDSEVKWVAASALESAVSALKEPAAVERVIDKLLAALTDPSSYVKEAAASALGTAASASKEPATVERVIDKLLAVLNGPDSYAKQAAASALGTAVSASKEPATVERVIDTLLAALNDSHSDVKRAAASALGTAVSASKEPATVEQVIDKLLAALNSSESYGPAYVEAMASLSRIDHERGLQRAVFECDQWIHENAVDIEGEQHRLDQPEILELMRSGCAHHRAQAKSDRGLLNALESDDSRERVFAWHVLARRKEIIPSTLARIRQLRHDSRGRPWVKYAALRCLVEIERERLARIEDAERAKQKTTPTIVE